MAADKKEVIFSETADICETKIGAQFPEILEILLRDRTTSNLTKKKCNIIWANDNYTYLDAKAYAPTAHILPGLITGENEGLIMPRALKTAKQQKQRTKARAEVFTPTWVIKLQNDELEKDYLSDDLATYTKRTWLEITCGEAPYIASRYDMQTGKTIALDERVGFLDRKLRRINLEVNTKDDWQAMAILAYKASFGFEWSGDSLLLARENLLYTALDYYKDKWQDEMPYGLMKKLAVIISYNLFQMDGIKRIIPLSDEEDKPDDLSQPDLFGFLGPLGHSQMRAKRVKIMNWDNNRLEYFDEGVM